VFFTLFYPSMSPNASFALISFFLHSLAKAPDNNTPAIKITSSSVSLEAMFVVHFVAAAFWRGCGQIFVAAASCATKVCVYVCSFQPITQRGTEYIHLTQQKADTHQ